MPVIPPTTRSQHVDFAYDQVVRPHHSYRHSGGLPRGKPRTRHMWICLQLSGARGVDNGGMKGKCNNTLPVIIIKNYFCLYYGYGDPNGFKGRTFLPSRASYFTFIINCDIGCTASVQPQICTLWYGVSKGMLPVKHLRQKISLAD